MNPSPSTLLRKAAPLWASLFLPLFLGAGLSAQKILVNAAPDITVPGDSYPSSFGSTKAFAFFWAGQFLEKGFWRTDGTKLGTLQLLPQTPGKFLKGPPTGIAWNNQYFFKGWDPKGGWELFKSDGSLKGTGLVKDLDPRTGSQQQPLSSEPRNFVISGGSLFFVADTAQGSTLFKSDGTPKGTLSIFSIQGNLVNLTPLGNKLVFEIQGNVSLQNGLAISDGTRTGTHVIFRPLSMDSGRGNKGFATLGSFLLFSAETYTSGTGKELFISDGTPKGTKLLKDIYPGTYGSQPSDFARLGNKIYFAAEDPKYGRELWSSDGTATGTVLVKDIEPKKRQGFPFSSKPTKLHALGNKLLFQAATLDSGEEPWISDGTRQGTFLLKDLTRGSASTRLQAILALGSHAYFVIPNLSKTYTLYRTDGTTQGTQPITELGIEWPQPISLTPYGNRFLFPNKDSAHGLEPWIGDGTPQGTKILVDLVLKRTLTQGSDPRNFRALGDLLYFSTAQLGHINSLWKTDVAGLGAKKITTVRTGARIQKAGDRILWMEGANPMWKLLAYDPRQKKITPLLTTQGAFSELNTLGEKWYFSEKPLNGKTLKFWVTDGTKAGTKPLSWIPSGSLDVRYSTIPFGRRALLIGPIYRTLPQKTFSIWLTDGSKAGTQALATITSPIPLKFIFPQGYAQWGNDLVFAFKMIDSRYASKTLLFHTNGTPAGTKLIKTLAQDRLPRIEALGGKFFFSLYARNTGMELWVSDGTPKGTKLLKDLLPGPASSFPSSMTRVGNRIVFSAYSPNLGWEIYVSDGTAKGTKLLKDIWPGKKSGLLRFLHIIPIGSRHVAFLANDGTSGKRLWVTDGTPSGTKPASRPLKDADTNIDLENPRFALGRLFYSWATRAYGREPWAWFPGASAHGHDFGCGTEPSLEASDPVLGSTMRFVGQLSKKQPVAVLMLGPTAPIPLRMPGGCYLHVDPYRLIVPVPVQARLGKWNLVVPVPNKPSLSGLLFQAQVLHPLKGGGFDLSNPVDCVLGR